MKQRRDTAVRVSKWLDRVVEKYLSDKEIRIEFPSKRNFVDKAVMKLLKERGALTKNERKSR